MSARPAPSRCAGTSSRPIAFDRRVRAADEGFPAAGATLAATDAAPGVVFERDGLRVTAFAVDHGQVATPAYGYRVDYQGRVGGVLR